MTSQATEGALPVRSNGAFAFGDWTVYAFDADAGTQLSFGGAAHDARIAGDRYDTLAVATRDTSVRVTWPEGAAVAAAFPPVQGDTEVPPLSPAGFRVMRAIAEREDAEVELTRLLGRSVRRHATSTARAIRLAPRFAALCIPGNAGARRTYGRYVNCRFTVFAADGRSAAIETAAVATETPQGPHLVALIEVPPDGRDLAVYREDADGSEDASARVVWAQDVADDDLYRSFAALETSAEPRVLIRGLLRAAVAAGAAPAERALRAHARRFVHQMELDKPFGFFIDDLIAFAGRGYLVRGWMHDPRRLIAGASIVPPSGKAIPIQLDQCRIPRNDVLQFYGIEHAAGDLRPGFVAFAEDPETDDSRVDDIVVTLGGLGTITITSDQPPLDPLEKRRKVLDAVEGEDVLDMRRLAPAFAAAQHEVVRDARVASRHRYGEAQTEPEYSIVVPLYRRIDFVRYQLAEFANDPKLADAEVVYVLDSPEQRRELLEHLASWTRVWPCRVLLVVMERNVGYAAATNTGVAESSGSVCVLLNSDVIPARAGWLGSMHRALTGIPSVGVVGAQLLYEDQAIQHAGMYYGENRLGLWSNEHYFKGYPSDFPAANVSRQVPAVTGACMMVRRELYDALGGLSEDYCVGDFEDSDFCNKAAAAGYRSWYESTAVLFHLERQSFGLSGYNHAGWRYNQWLHESRWRAIAERALVVS